MRMADGELATGRWRQMWKKQCHPCEVRPPPMFTRTAHIRNARFTAFCLGFMKYFLSLLGQLQDILIDFSPSSLLQKSGMPGPYLLSNLDSNKRRKYPAVDPKQIAAN